MLLQSVYICIGKLYNYWFRQWLVAWSAPSYYLNQCRLIMKWKLRNERHYNWSQTARIPPSPRKKENGSHFVFSILWSTHSHTKGIINNYVMEVNAEGILRNPNTRSYRAFPWWWTSNGNIFRVTGPLYREFTGHRWIPLTKASDSELWCFLCSPWIKVE